MFRYGTRTFQTHHFVVDRRTGKIEIWETWLQKGPLIFNGTYQLQGRALAIQGKFENPESAANLVLEREE